MELAEIGMSLEFGVVLYDLFCTYIRIVKVGNHELTRSLLFIFLNMLIAAGIGKVANENLFNTVKYDIVFRN